MLPRGRSRQPRSQRHQPLDAHPRRALTGYAAYSNGRRQAGRPRPQFGPLTPVKGSGQQTMSSLVEPSASRQPGTPEAQEGVSPHSTCSAVGTHHPGASGLGACCPHDTSTNVTHHIRRMVSVYLGVPPRSGAAFGSLAKTFPAARGRAWAKLGEAEEFAGGSAAFHGGSLAFGGGVGRFAGGSPCRPRPLPGFRDGPSGFLGGRSSEARAPAHVHRAEPEGGGAARNTSDSVQGALA
jgi:hypothetical protein